MKKLLALLMILSCGILNAQDSRQRSLRFTYIYHTPDTPVAELCQTLTNAFNDARNYNLPTIFYLAYMDTPYVAIAGMGKNDVEGFEKIINRLQEKRFHSVDPSGDLKKLIELFDEYDFLTEWGVPKYESMYWSFYVNQEYWDANYNELIIAKLFYALDLGTLPDDFLRFQIFYSGTDEFHCDKKYPFGQKNLCPELKTIELIEF